MSALHPDATDDGVLYVTRSPALRACWHPVAHTHELSTEPIARQVLGTSVVVWRDAAGTAIAALDRCPHRWARLSAGTVVNGSLQCRYHGWRFDSHGAAIEIPQLEPGSTTPSAACLETIHAREQLGMVWLNLDRASSNKLPTVPEFNDARFRAIPIGVINYHTNAAAVIDNNTDATHVAFVHANSFGADQNPRIATSRVERTTFGIEIASDEMPVAVTPASGRPGTRTAVTQIWLPFTQVGRLNYSDGSTHILIKGCCPVDDDHTDVHLTVLRNDADNPVDADDIIQFELTVENEDKTILDTVPAGFPLDLRRQVHIKHDRPGVAYRRALIDLISAQMTPDG